LSTPDPDPPGPSGPPAAPDPLAQLAARLDAFTQSLPGQIRRFAQEALDARGASGPPDRVATLEGELKSLRDSIAHEKKQNALLKALRQHEWLDGVEDLVAASLAPQMRLRDDGTPVLPAQEGSPGGFAEELGIEEAVRRFADARPALLKARLQDGTGAGRGNFDAPSSAAPRDFQALLNDHAAYAHWSERDPALVERLERAHFEKRGSRK
jgi:hypothetical protein